MLKNKTGSWLTILTATAALTAAVTFSGCTGSNRSDNMTQPRQSPGAQSDQTSQGGSMATPGVGSYGTSSSGSSGSSSR